MPDPTGRPTGRRVDRSRRYEDSRRSTLVHPLVLPAALVLTAYDGLLGLALVTGRPGTTTWPWVLLVAAAVTGLLALGGVRL